MPEEKDIEKKLILADGTVLENCECGYSNRNLWCFLTGIPFSEAFQYFSGPEKFKKVTFVMRFGNIIDTIEYSGFEQITAVQQSEFTVDVRLEGYKIDINRSKHFATEVSSNDEGGE